MIFENVEQLENELHDIVVLNDEVIVVKNEQKLREFGIDYLIYAGVLSDDATTRHLARVYIRKIAERLGVFPASIYPLYKARGEGEVNGFTVPAMNMRAMTYDVAREIFKKAKEHEANAFLFEISRTEMVYTDQTQDELAVCALSAAIKEGYEGPVFLQGDHYQFDAKKFSEYSQGQIDDIELSIKDALSAGFYNIDIDASTLVDLSLKEKYDQQKNNFEMTALLTKFINSKQPSGVTVAIGGEIGHIGDTNSDVADFEAFMKGYLAKLEDYDGQIIDKVAVQTGTAHGGVVDKSGKVEKMSVDFSILESIGKVAREKFGISGCVQHGASTLPNEEFSKFPKVETSEIHLATGFQNIIYDTMPVYMKEKLENYVLENFQNERKEGWTDEQLIYKMRKKAIGPHKKDLWLISESDKEVIRKRLSEELEILFQKLNIIGTAHTVRKYIGEAKEI